AEGDRRRPRLLVARRPHARFGGQRRLDLRRALTHPRPMCSEDDGCGPDDARRAFLAGSVGLAVTGMAGPARAQSTSPAPPPTRVLDDPGAVHGPVTFTHNGRASIGGYLARPRAEGPHPAVLVIAGNRISEEYIPNTC